MAVRGDHHSAITGVGIGKEMTCRGAVGVIGETLPGTLLRVCCKCIIFVSFNTRFFVGLGAAMIGGTLVILVMTGTSSLCITLSLLGVSTLCSTPCCGIGIQCAN